ncbi:THAP domain-containing protein [Phthorimaea operculella]|nr:THAP domain-containing protein [Phthorimaea operculella]
MPTCSVSCCKKKSGRSSLQIDGVSFHLFPKNPLLRSAWKRFCNNKLTWDPKRTNVICSVHFLSSDYRVLPNKRKLLAKNAIPRLIPDCICLSHPISTEPSNTTGERSATSNMFTSPGDSSSQQQHYPGESTSEGVKCDEPTEGHVRDRLSLPMNRKHRYEQNRRPSVCVCALFCRVESVKRFIWSCTNMVQCAVPCCKNDSRKQNKSNSNISFHRFPKNHKIRDAWVNAIKRPNWEPNFRSYICSIHFNTSYIKETKKGQRSLIEDAIPEFYLKANPSTLVQPGGLEFKQVSEEVIPCPNDTPRELHLKRRLRHVQETARKRRRRINVLYTERTRALKKIRTLSKILNDIRENKMISQEHDDIHDILELEMCGVSADDLEFNSSIDGDDSTDEDPHTRTSSDTQKHDFGIKCSNCRLKITGFRYTCVQCVDVELCGACDARGAHADHYVLRIPGTRPKDEVNEILSRVRATVKVLTQPKEGVQLDEPEIRIKTENEEVIDDPLGAKIKGESLQTPEPNARPHASNVLEQPMLEIPIIKTEYFEESETTVGDGNNVLEFELPGTSTAPYAMRARVPTNIRIKPDASDAPSVAKRPRVAPTATATSASTGPGGRTTLQHTIFSHAPVPPPKNSKPAEKNS